MPDSRFLTEMEAEYVRLDVHQETGVNANLTFFYEIATTNYQLRK